MIIIASQDSDTYPEKGASDFYLLATSNVWVFSKTFVLKTDLLNVVPPPPPVFIKYQVNTLQIFWQMRNIPSANVVPIMSFETQTQQFFRS